jgi:hypothetical protein
MGRNLTAGVIVDGLAARQPFADGGSVLERRLGQPLAKGNACVLSPFGLLARRHCFLDGHLRAVRHLASFART